LFRCSNSRERFSSVPQLYSITSKPVPAPALAPASAARHSCSFVIQARRTPLDEIRVVKAPKGVRERERKRERRFCFVFLSFLVPQSNKKLDPRPLTLPLPKKNEQERLVAELAALGELEVAGTKEQVAARLLEALAARRKAGNGSSSSSGGGGVEYGDEEAMKKAAAKEETPASAEASSKSNKLS